MQYAGYSEKGRGSVALYIYTKYKQNHTIGRPQNTFRNLHLKTGHVRNENGVDWGKNAPGRIPIHPFLKLSLSLDNIHRS